MSWSRRALLLAPLALGACGFHPLYGEAPTGPEEPQLASIRVLPIAERMGQELALALRESFNPHGESATQTYLLSTALTQSRVDLGIQRDATSTRGRVDAYATITLTEIKTNKVVYTGRVQSTSAFNILQDGYAAQVAEDDARERMVRDLAVEIHTRLALVLRAQKKKSSGTG
jgi:LPS-assembly lipoprotein